ncbi:MAG: tetratricopeptide repeat protein, partial [Candidatus Thermoplasmatota archaeon]|nr:tetratricopeptide repeat protein [Candidatus Thermoplasmatota archaeon]
MKPRVLLSVVISIFIFSSGAICASNDTASDLLKVGYEKIAKNDLEAAIENFNEAISIDPKNPQAYAGLGNVYARKGDTEAAIENFNKAISIDPKNSQAYAGLGNVYARKGDIEAAIENFNEAISIDPKKSQAYAG